MQIKINDKDWELPNHEIFEFKPKSSNYCICIPIINEGEKFKKQLAQMSSLAKTIDILILDGGSNDGSTDKEFLRQRGVRTLLVKKDTGKLSAQLRMGYAYALRQGYSGIITVDGNGKDSVESIPQFIAELEKGFDYVQGSRFVEGGKGINTPLSRFLAIRLIHAPLISLAARKWLTDTTNGFRAYSSKFLLEERVKPFRRIFDRYELLAYLSARACRLGFRVREIGVMRKYPKGKIPTKISSFAGNIDLLKTLVLLNLGKFNPEK